MNFSECKADVAKWVLDLPLSTQSLIGTWVNDAIRTAERGHNFRHMEASAEFTTVAAQRKLGDLPVLWKEARDDPWLRGNAGAVQEIDWAASESDMRRQYSSDPTTSTGAPKFVLQTSTELHVFPFSDSRSDFTGGEYRVNVSYWAYSAQMEEDEDTTMILTLDDQYVVWKAAAMGFIFNQDEQRGAEFLALAKDRYDAMVRSDKRSRIPARPTLNPRRGVFGPGLRPRPTSRSI